MKNITFVALAIGLVASASVCSQTYPTPTFSTLTLIHPLTPANGGTGVTSATGSGSVVLSDSPTLVTPDLGAPTSLSLVNATDLPLGSGVSGILPVANGGTGTDISTGGGALVKAIGASLYSPTLTSPIMTDAVITGVTDGSDASPGDLGQFLTSDGTQALVSGAPADVASLSLTPGDWDVIGGCEVSGPSGVLSDASCGLSMTTETLGAAGSYLRNAGASFTAIAGAVPVMRISVSSTSQVYLVGAATFGTGSAAASGYLSARRVR